MISYLSPPPPGAANPPPRLLGAAWPRLAAGVYLYSPQIQTDNRPFLFRLSLARDKPEDNELGEKNSVFDFVVNIIIVEQTFSTYGNSRRGGGTTACLHFCSTLS